MDREFGWFGCIVIVTVLGFIAVIVVGGPWEGGSEDGFPEEGAEPGFDGGELVRCERREGDGDC